MSDTGTTGGLWSHSLISFRDAVAHQPMPGCGATAVVSADLGLALVLKGLQLGQRHEANAERAGLIDEGEALKRALAPLADADVAAFEAFMAALGRDRHDTQRRAAIGAAAADAVEVPLRTARHCAEALALAERALAQTERQFIGDALAGARLLHAALHAVLLNVDANLEALGDDDACRHAAAEHDGLAQRSDALLDAIVTARG